LIRLDAEALGQRFVSHRLVIKHWLTIVLDDVEAKLRLQVLVKCGH